MNKHYLAMIEARHRVTVAAGELEDAKRVMRCAEHPEAFERAEREWIEALRHWQYANAALARLGRIASPRHSPAPFRNALYPPGAIPNPDPPPEAA